MASGDKIFLDTDVALDHLADRQPFAEYVHRILALAETGELTICISSLSFSNLYYILRKLKGHAGALALLGKLKMLVRVSSVGESEIQSALLSQFKDFEDAIQHFAYANAGHPNPLHVQPRAGSVHAMSGSERSDPALGLFDDVVYRTSERAMNAGDVLLLFTDGVFEVDGPVGEQFSHELLRSTVQRRAHRAPPQLLSELLAEIRQFSASESFSDDVCVIAIEVTRLC